MRPPSQAGLEFENYVAHLYEQLGFAVEQDVLLDGNQVDLVVRKTLAGIGQTTRVVECKQRRKKAVTVAEVRNFFGLVESVRSGTKITGGVLVSSTSFTRAARAAAADSELVSLLTIRNLEQELFDFHNAYAMYITDYESRRICSRYIGMEGEVTYGIGAGKREKIEDILATLIQWIHSGAQSLVAVLGDFGAGKTTLMERLKYQLAREFLDLEGGWRPVLLLLRDFFRVSDVDLLLEHTLLREFGRPIPAATFWETAEDGGFVVLLDGFDEMVPTASRDERARLFARLSRFFALPGTTILTCRPTLFVTQDEYEDALRRVVSEETPYVASPLSKGRGAFPTGTAQANALRGHLSRVFLVADVPVPLEAKRTATVEVQPFDGQHIETFLRQQDKSFRSASGNQYGWKAVLAFLRSVYDLSDLMRRPLLLDMVTESVVAGAMDITDESLSVGPSSLYEIYTDMNFSREWEKGAVRRQSLTREQRRVFTEALAVAVYERGEVAVDYDVILSTVARVAEVGSETAVQDLRNQTPEEVADDIRICSFLSRRPDGLFQFSHKSFMEFFVARYLHDRITWELDEPLLRQQIPKEILYFLGGYGVIEESFRSKIVEAYERLLRSSSELSEEVTTLLRNLACTIIYAAVRHNALNFRGAKLTYIDIEKKSFEGCEARGLFCRTVRLSMVQALWSRLIDLNGVDVHGRDLQIENSVISGVLRGCEFRGVEFKKTSLTLSGQDLLAESVKVDGGSVTLRGALVVRDFVMGGDAKLSCSLEAGVLEKGRLSSSEVVSTGKTRLEQVEMEECWVSLDDEAELSKSSLAGGALRVKVRRPGNPAVKGCKLEGVQVEFVAPGEGGEVEWRDGMKECQLRSCSVYVSGVRAEECVLEDCTVRISPRGERKVVLDSLDVRGGRMWCRPQGGSDALQVLISGRFRNCFLVGVPLVVGEVGLLELEKGKDALGRIRGCRGVVINLSTGFSEKQVIFERFAVFGLVSFLGLVARRRPKAPWDATAGEQEEWAEYLEWFQEGERKGLRLKA